MRATNSTCAGAPDASASVMRRCLALRPAPDAAGISLRSRRFCIVPLVPPPRRRSSPRAGCHTTIAPAAGPPCAASHVAWRWRGWGSSLGARPRSLRRLLPARSGQRGAWADVGGFRLTSPSIFNNDKGQVKEPVSSTLVTKGQEHGAASWRTCEFTLAWRTRCGTPGRRFHVHKRHVQSATRVLARSRDIPISMPHTLRPITSKDGRFLEMSTTIRVDPKRGVKVSSV